MDQLFEKSNLHDMSSIFDSLLSQETNQAQYSQTRKRKRHQLPSITEKTVYTMSFKNENNKRVVLGKATDYPTVPFGYTLPMTRKYEQL